MVVKKGHKRFFIPKEHGAWAVLYVSFVTGVCVAARSQVRETIPSIGGLQLPWNAGVLLLFLAITFGYLSRDFIRSGADLIVNLTNDSWSHSVASEMQHMSMAVFRAVENKRTVVRSTNGGITCTIDPNGRITSILDPFIEGYLVSDVPVYDKQVTLYTKWGDWLGIGAVYAGLVAIALGIVLGIMRRRKED